MKKSLLLVLLLLAVVLPLMTQSYRLSPYPRLQFFTNTGAVASGYKLCTFASGTSTPLAAYSNSTGTALPNPITLNSAGRVQTAGLTESGLYLGIASYKINLYAAGTGNTCNGTAVGSLIWSQEPVITTPSFGGTVQSVTFSTTPSFDASVAQFFDLTLTGNVTSSTITNAVSGSVVQFKICQDGTGSRTFVWPGTVSAPPIISNGASDCTYSAFRYSGTAWTPWGLNGTQGASGFRFMGAVVIPTALTVGTNAVANGASFAVPGGRLTTESGVPISTTDRTAQGTIYYTPYINTQLWMYTASVWTYYAFSQESLAITATSGKNYDVFDYANAGAPTLELSAAWASDSTRTDALARQDGVWVKSSDHSRLWLGTIRASGANVTADSIGGATTQVGGQGFVCNYYNAVLRPLKVVDKTASWSYTTATIRQANAAAGNKVEAVFCDVGNPVDAVVFGMVGLASNASQGASMGVSLDNTTTYSGLATTGESDAVTTAYFSLQGKYAGYPGLGYHYFAWTESGGASTSTFLGLAGAGLTQSGLTAFTLR